MRLGLADSSVRAEQAGKERAFGSELGQRWRSSPRKASSCGGQFRFDSQA